MSALFIGHPKETHLALFAGGELGPVSRWRIERHLQNCDSCQTTVSDFFHLQGELTELSELPSSIEWDSMALRIREAVAEAGAIESERVPGFFSKPLVLRFGLATATVLCTFIVVQQLPFQKSPDPLTATFESAEAPAASAFGESRLSEGIEDLEQKDGLLPTSKADYEIAGQEQQKAYTLEERGGFRRTPGRESSIPGHPEQEEGIGGCDATRAYGRCGASAGSGFAGETV